MRSVSRRLIDRIMGILLSLLMLLNMFPAVAVYAEDAKPTVYFEVLDEEGNVLDANASVKKDDVIQLNMYLSSGTGASMMDFLVSYDNDVVENINQYVNGAQGAHQYKECLVGSVLSGATTNPQYEENGTRYIKFLHEQLDPIEQGGLIATYKFKVLSARGGTTAFSVEKDRDDFIFYDGDMESLPFTQESASVKVADSRQNLADATVELAQNEYTYSGKVIEPAVKTVTVNGSVVPSDEYDVAYSNNIDAGDSAEYIITAKDTSDNYYGSYTGKFIIAPKSGADCIVEIIDVAYTGMPANPVVSVKDGTTLLTQDVDYTVEALATEAGSQKAIVRFQGNYAGEKVVDYKILPIAQTDDLTIIGIPAGGVPYAENGTLQLNTLGGNGTGTVSWNSSNESVAVIDATGKVTITGVGRTKITATKAKDTNYNTEVSATAMLIVNKTAGVVTVTIENWTYGQNAKKSVVKSETNPGTAKFVYKVKGTDDSTYTENVPTNAGNYTVKAMSPATDNYEAAEATADFVIEKATVDVSSVMWNVGGPKTYNGKEQGVSLTGLPEDLVNAELTGDKAVKAGKYEAKAELSLKDSNNYTLSATNVSAEWEIQPALVTIKADDKTVRVNSKAPEFTYTVTGLLNGDTLTKEPTAVCNADFAAAGNYSITFTGASAGNNYDIRYEAGTLYVVEKDPQSVSFDESEKTAVYGSEGFTVKVKHDKGDGEITYSSSNPEVATVDAKTGAVTITGAGTTSVTATAAATMDYAETSAHYTLTVTPKKVNPSITIETNAIVYDETEKRPEVVVKDGNTVFAADSYTVVYTNNINAGKATVTVTMKGNYSGAAKSEFVIEPAAIDVSGVTWKLPENAVYNAQPYKVELVNIPEHVAIKELSGDEATNAGKYTAMVVLEADSSNYTLVGKYKDVQDWTIEKAKASVVALDHIVRVGADVPDFKNPQINVDYKVEGLYGNDVIDGITMRVENASTTEESEYPILISGPESTDNYTITYTNATLKVANKQIPEINFAVSVEKTYGDADFALTASATSNGSITYTSSNESVVKVDSTIGVITIEGAGNAVITATVSETADYEAGTASSTVMVNKKTVTPEIEVADCTYTGKPQEPSFVVKADGKVTEAYNAVYANNTNAGMAEVRVELTDKNYAGTATKSFAILPKNLTGTAVVAKIDDQPFDGVECEPPVTVADGDITLVAGTDYDITYTNNKHVGTATATITFKGNYTGSVSTSFEIVAADASGVSIAAIEDQTYTGMEITPGVKVALNGKLLSAGEDYTVTYSDNINVGTGHVTITFVGNYKGTAETVFAIKAKDISGSAEVEEIADQTYTGDPILPKLTVKDGNVVLEENKDYTVVYEKNTNVAESPANVKITFIGNYAGNTTASFKILPAELKIENVTSTWNRPIYQIVTNEQDVADSLRADVTFNGKKINGTFVWEKDTDFVPGQSDYTWIFIPVEEYKDNFTTVTGTIQLSVIYAEKLSEQQVVTLDENVTTVPEGLTYADVTAMKAAMMGTMSGATDANTKLYDVKLWIVTDGQWVEASADDFPKDGLTFKIAYPESTNGKDFNFRAVHIFTKAMNGHAVGEIETAGIEKTESGVTVKVNGLSPVAISWTKGQHASNDKNNATSGKSNGSSTTNSSTQKAEENVRQAVKAATIPQTSDNSHPALLVVICLAAGFGLAVTVLKKRNTK